MGMFSNTGASWPCIVDYAQKGGEEGRDSRGAERRGEGRGMGRGWLSGL